MAGLTVEQRIQRAVEQRIAEMVSSGGLTMGRGAIEILYLLPPDFVEAYTELFHQALTGTDGGSGARGEAAAKTRALGRAPGKAAKNTRRFRGLWTIGSEKALQNKELADKRLRTLARDIKRGLQQLEQEELAKGKKGAKGMKQFLERSHCPNCRQFVKIEWKYCPSCGTRCLRLRVNGEGKEEVGDLIEESSGNGGNSNDEVAREGPSNRS